MCVCVCVTVCQRDTFLDPCYLSVWHFGLEVWFPCHVTEKLIVCSRWSSFLHLRKKGATSGRRYNKCGWLRTLPNFLKFIKFVEAGKKTTLISLKKVQVLHVFRIKDCSRLMEI